VFDYAQGTSGGKNLHIPWQVLYKTKDKKGEDEESF
jgi:hypothetical protein